MSDQPEDSGKPDDPAPAPAPVLSVVPAPAPQPEEPASEPAPSEADLFDPNRNIVYDVLYDIGDLEMVARLKWDRGATSR